jgi:hypothetical protein
MVVLFWEIGDGGHGCCVRLLQVEQTQALCFAKEGDVG